MGALQEAPVKNDRVMSFGGGLAADGRGRGRGVALVGVVLPALLGGRWLELPVGGSCDDQQTGAALVTHARKPHHNAIMWRLQSSFSAILEECRYFC